MRYSFVDSLKLLVKDIDERGDLKDWHGFAKNKHEWKRMIMNRIRVEKGELGDGDEETPNNATCEQNNNTTNSTPRRLIPNSDSRHKMSPNREIIELTNMNRR